MRDWFEEPERGNGPMPLPITEANRREAFWVAHAWHDGDGESVVALLNTADDLVKTFCSALDIIGTLVYELANELTEGDEEFVWGILLDQLSTGEHGEFIRKVNRK